MTVARSFAKRAHLIADSADRTVEVVIDPSANRLSWVRYRSPSGELLLNSELAAKPLGLIVYLSATDRWRSGHPLTPDERDQIAADLAEVIRLLIGHPYID